MDRGPSLRNISQMKVVLATSCAVSLSAFFVAFDDFGLAKPCDLNLNKLIGRFDPGMSR